MRLSVLPRAPPGAYAVRVTVKLPEPDDDGAFRLTGVVDALIAGHDAAAEAELLPIAGQTLATHPLVALPMRESAYPVGTGPKTRNPHDRDVARVFARDHFTCVYCGRRTVVLQVMQMVSHRFPLVFPFHDNWKGEVAHRLYWDISTSLEHITPVSLGGSWDDPENLACACYRCQDQKNNRRIADLGWTPTTRSSGWDGLVSRLAPLRERLGTPKVIASRRTQRLIGYLQDALEASSWIADRPPP